jgi:small conductance mechanosensitive channel
MLHFLQASEGVKKVLPSLDEIKQDIQQREDKLSEYIDQLIRIMVEYAPRMVSAIIVLFIGMWLIKRIGRISEKAMIRRDLDISLRTFLRSLISIGLRIILIVTVAGMIGIGTTSFVAILGAAGLAVGLALQGSLSNFAGGVLILIFKPFKVGDSIEAGGQSGEVKEIQIFNTILLTADHKTVILPNGPLSNGTIVNTTRHGDIRLDIILNVSTENNLHEVKQIIARTLSENEKVLKTPAPGILIGKVSEGSVIINVKPYSLLKNATSLNSELNEQFKQVFEKHGIRPGTTPK